MKKKKLEFYAFIYDWNSKSLHKINVLSMFEDKKDFNKMMKFYKVNSLPGLKEAVKRSLMYRFWCKAEYEVLVYDLFPKAEDLDSGIKIDVWYQIESNLDIIVDLISKYYNLEF